MKVLKSHMQLTALALSIVFTNTVLAAESKSDESKDNGVANAISNADLANTVNADVVASPVETQANAAVSEQQDAQPLAIDDAQSYRKQFEARRRQMQEAQLEAYKQFLERRKQYSAFSNAEFNNNVPAHIQERRNEYIKQMEERRALNDKMIEEHRKAAEERRKAMQLKMHQTNTAPELTNKA